MFDEVLKFLDFLYFELKRIRCSMSANPMNKWRIDLGGGQRSVSRTHDGSLSPPGYIPNFTQGSQHVERVQQDQQQQHLMSKRAWVSPFFNTRCPEINQQLVLGHGTAADQISANECFNDVHVSYLFSSALIPSFNLTHCI
jgi:hypothetical protein